MARAFLQIVAGHRAGAQVPVPETVPLVIGRKKGDLVLDDPLVSGVHARIIYRDEQWVIQDLSSTNGTMVDGRLVREAQLRPGNEIAIGSCRMILFLGSEEDPQAAERRAGGQQQLDIAWLLDEELVDVKKSGDQTRSQGDVIGQDLRLPPGMNAVLEAVAGPDAGKVFRFTRGTVTIGRRAGEIPLTDPEVSRRHTVVEVFGRGMIYLRDLGSTNGTFHNGRRVSIGRIRAGDTVGVGRSVLKMHVKV
ncbi:MAG: FHA domain-containing protein [Pseudomonadota bacterium]